MTPTPALAESALAELHVERLRRALPWPLYHRTLARVTGKTSANRLTAAEAERVLRALECTRIPARERTGDRPSWRLVGTVLAAGELAFGNDPERTEAWFAREFGGDLYQADTPTVVRAIARLRAVRAAQRCPAE